MQIRCMFHAFSGVLTCSLEFGSVIGGELGDTPVLADDISSNEVGNVLGRLVSKRSCLQPFGEVVSRVYDIFVAVRLELHIDYVRIEFSENHWDRSWVNFHFNFVGRP